MNNMKHNRPLIAVVLAAIAASCGGARSSTEYTAGPNADFRTAAVAEVRDTQDQVVLRGSFVETAAAGGDDIERKAVLATAGTDADASGEVEVESCRNTDCRSQEVEFSVVNVQPGASFRFVIDGKVFATVTADSRGRAEVERDVPLPR
jgi:hypothetical protein